MIQNPEPFWQPGTVTATRSHSMENENIADSCNLRKHKEFIVDTEENTTFEQLNEDKKWKKLPESEEKDSPADRQFTEKSKILPVFSDLLANAPKSLIKTFPIIYIGAPCIRDMQAYSLLTTPSTRNDEANSNTLNNKKSSRAVKRGFYSSNHSHKNTLDEHFKSKDLKQILHVLSQHASKEESSKSKKQFSTKPLCDVLCQDSLPTMVHDPHSTKFKRIPTVLTSVNKPMYSTNKGHVQLPLKSNILKKEMLQGNKKSVYFKSSANLPTTISKSVYHVPFKSLSSISMATKTSLSNPLNISDSLFSKPLTISAIKPLFPPVVVTSCSTIDKAPFVQNTCKGPSLQDTTNSKTNEIPTKADENHSNQPIVITSTAVIDSKSTIKRKMEDKNTIVKKLHVLDDTAELPVSSESPLLQKTIEDENRFQFNGKSGALIRFEDGVQMWIDKRKDLTFLDDEPVLSWNLKPGTEVAAKYKDGLFYDAVVVQSFSKSPASSNSNLMSQEGGVKPLETKHKNKVYFTSGSDKVPSTNLRSVPQVKIKKLSLDSCTKVIVPDPAQSGAVKPAKVMCQSKLPYPPVKVPQLIKCPNCFLVFKTVVGFRAHQKSVCGSKGYMVYMDKRFSPDLEVQVDDIESPPVVSYVQQCRKEGKDSFMWNSRDGKRWFKRGTKFMHRWQTPDGASKWYNGKVLSLLDAKKEEFEVEYKDDDYDKGPYVVTLYEDFPNDIRIVVR